MTAARQLGIAARGWRAWRWQPMIGSWLLAAAVLGWQGGAVTHPAAALNLLRGVAVILSLGVLFVLDDQAHNVIAAAPVSLAVRTTVRVAAAVAGCAAVWLATLAMTEMRAGVHVPAGISVELAALLGCGLAAAAIAQRFLDVPEPGLAAGPFLIGLLLGLSALPQRWAFVVSPGAGWVGAHLRWSSLLAIAALVLATGTRDPAARQPRRRAAPERLAEARRSDG